MDAAPQLFVQSETAAGGFEMPDLPPGVFLFLFSFSIRKQKQKQFSASLR